MVFKCRVLAAVVVLAAQVFAARRLQRAREDVKVESQVALDPVCQTLFLLDGRSPVELPDTWNEARQGFAEVCEQEVSSPDRCDAVTEVAFQDLPADDSLVKLDSALCGRLNLAMVAALKDETADVSFASFVTERIRTTKGYLPIFGGGTPCDANNENCEASGWDWFAVCLIVFCCSSAMSCWDKTTRENNQAVEQAARDRDRAADDARDRDRKAAVARRMQILEELSHIVALPGFWTPGTAAHRRKADLEQEEQELKDLEKQISKDRAEFQAYRASERDRMREELDMARQG